jgi:glutaconate CoA-transferase subunit A
MVSRYQAGASGLPFMPIRSYEGSDLPSVNPAIRRIDDPYGTGPVWLVPPLRPDVAIVAVQRADVEGNSQIWGLTGCQREAAYAAERVVVVCEELVDESVIRADPNRTVVPGLIVDAVVHLPWSCHPSFAQGYQDRDNAFYLAWDAISRDQQALADWLEEWVTARADHAGYLAHLGEERLESLRVSPALSGQVSYGRYG